LVQPLFTEEVGFLGSLLRGRLKTNLKKRKGAEITRGGEACREENGLGNVQSYGSDSLNFGEKGAKRAQKGRCCWVFCGGEGEGKALRGGVYGWA